VAYQEKLTGKWVVRNARESSNLAELLICKRAARFSVSQVEGLALLGLRAAVLLPKEDTSLEAFHSDPPRMVYHRIRKANDKIDYALPFELQACDAQEAIYHCLLAHDIAARLNIAGLCSMDERLAERLENVRLPSQEMIDSLTPINNDGHATHDEAKIRAVVAQSFTDFKRRFQLKIDTVQSYNWQAEGICIVTAGSYVETALKISEALNHVDRACSVLKIALTAPFPTDDVATLLAKQQQIIVIGDCKSREFSAVWSGIRQALFDLDKRPSLSYLFGNDEEFWSKIALLLKFSEENLNEASTTLKAKRRIKIAAAPAGSLARGLLLDLANYLCRNSGLRAFDVKSPHKLISLIELNDGEAPDPHEGIDCLFLSHPGLIDVSDILASLKHKAAVLIQGRSVAELSFWPLFSKEQKRSIEERELRLYSLSNDVVGEYQSIGSLGSFAVHGAMLRCLENNPVGPSLAQLKDAGILYAQEFAKLSAGWEAAEPVDRSIDNKLDTDPYFMPQRLIPKLLPAPRKRDESLEWKLAIRQFFLTGQSSYSKNHPLPALSIRPAALNPLLQRLESEQRYPLILLSKDAGSLKTQSLHDGLLESLGDDLAAQEFVNFAQEQMALIAQPPQNARELIASLLESYQNTLQTPDETLAKGVKLYIAALPHDAEIIGLNENTLLNFYISAVRAARRKRMADVIAEIKSLVIRLKDALRTDDEYGPVAISSTALSGALGDAGATFLNTEKLAGKLLSQPRGHKMYEPERVARMRTSLKTLEDFLAQINDSLDLILLHSGRLPDADAYPRVRIIKHQDTIELATGIFDAIAENHVTAFKAMRVARLDIAGDYDPDTHANILEQFSWQDISYDELRLLPVVCIGEASSSLYSMLTQLSQLIRSGRPIDVLALDSTSELMVSNDPLQRPHPYNPGFSYLATAYREAFVAQSSLARPEQLLQTLYKMNELPRPAVAVVTTPTWGWRLPPLVQLEAAHYGRTAPLFQYDPSIGHTRLERFSIDENPQADAIWPKVSISTIDESGYTQNIDAAFTFAHALALEPGYHQYFRILPNEAWNDELIEVWDFLQNPRFDSPQIPFIWGVIDGILRKCVMTREVANTCIDRMQRWTTLQELSFSNKTQLQRSVAALAEKTKQNQEQEIAEIQSLHATQLEQIQREAYNSALDCLQQHIEELRGKKLNIAQQRDDENLDPAKDAVAENKDTPQPHTGANDAPAAPPTPPSATESRDPKAPFIDSARCLSCGACLAISETLFVFNDDMKAELGERSEGDHELLVQAAELCPAECIYPGLEEE